MSVVQKESLHYSQITPAWFLLAFKDPKAFIASCHLTSHRITALSALGVIIFALFLGMVLTPYQSRQLETYYGAVPLTPPLTPYPTPPITPPMTPPPISVCNPSDMGKIDVQEYYDKTKTLRLKITVTANTLYPNVALKYFASDSSAEGILLYPALSKRNAPYRWAWDGKKPSNSKEYRLVFYVYKEQVLKAEPCGEWTSSALPTPKPTPTSKPKR